MSKETISVPFDGRTVQIPLGKHVVATQRRNLKTGQWVKLKKEVEAVLQVDVTMLMKFVTRASFSPSGKATAWVGAVKMTVTSSKDLPDEAVDL